MTHTLLVMRHAKSSWRTADPDHDRPLSDRGVRDATAAGELLAGYAIDVLLCSSATRTRQTWQTAELAGARAGQVRVSDELYGCWPDTVVDLLAGLDESVGTAMVLGHEPTMSELIATLTRPNADGEPVTEFPTSALAQIELPGRWSDVGSSGARVVRFEVPRG